MVVMFDFIKIILIMKLCLCQVNNNELKISPRTLHAY